MTQQPRTPGTEAGRATVDALHAALAADDIYIVHVERVAEYAWEQVNDHVGQRSWRWTDLNPDEKREALQEARAWLRAHT